MPLPRPMHHVQPITSTSCSLPPAGSCWLTQAVGTHLHTCSKPTPRSYSPVILSCFMSSAHLNISITPTQIHPCTCAHSHQNPQLWASTYLCILATPTPSYAGTTLAFAPEFCRPYPLYMHSPGPQTTDSRTCTATSSLGPCIRTPIS